MSFKNFILVLKSAVLKEPEKKAYRILTVTLILIILTSLVTLIYLIVAPEEGRPFTEFYILGHNGIADNYPTKYTLGENRTVIVGIVNHEYKPINYTLEVRIDNRSLSLPEKVKQISLCHNATWKEPLTITPSFEGKNMKLEFLLFNETERTVPYRSLHLWIDVTNKSGEN